MIALVSWLWVGCLWFHGSGLSISGLMTLGGLAMVSWLWVGCLWSLGSESSVSGLLALDWVSLASWLWVSWLWSCTHAGPPGTTLSNQLPVACFLSQLVS